MAIGHLRPTLGFGFSIDNTALAVDFFFILSAFVLSHAYEEKLQQRGSFLVFFLQRLIRLYPLIVLGMTFGAALFIVRGGAVAAASGLLASGLAMLPSEHIGAPELGVFPLNPPTWSLLLEIMASIAFGLGFWRGWRTIPILLIAGVWLVGAVLRNGTIDAGWSLATLPLGIARVAFGFTVGIIIFRMIGKATLPAMPFAGIAGCLAMVLVCAIVTPSFQLAAAFFILPIIVILGAKARPGNVRLCRWLGDLSYPLYILHWPVFVAVGTVHARWSFADSNAVVIAVAVLCAVVTSVFALKFYDEPLRRRMTVMLLRRRSCV